MTIDLSTQLAAWKAGTLRQRPTRALLGKLESAFRARQERLTQYGALTTPREIGELNDLKREFREQWNRMRQEIIVGYDADIETQRRAANPPTTNDELQRMSLLSGVHLPVWQRSPGTLVASAIEFEQQSDLAGLKLSRQHVGLLAPGQRRKAAATIDEALSDLKTEGQRKAELEVRSLEIERARFEVGTATRRSSIRATTEPMNAPAATSPAAVPQR